MDKDIRVIRTKRYLAHALFKLLETVPFEKISVMDICEKALVHRATFYNHFESKEQLLEYAINELKETLFYSAVKEETYSNPGDMYLSLIEKVIDFVQENRRKILSILNHNSFEKAAGFIAASIKKSLTYLIDRNQYKENFAIPVEILIDFLSGGITNIGLNWLISPNPYPKQELMRYFELFLNDRKYLEV
jgi:AcrR family transcriptional regulator